MWRKASSEKYKLTYKLLKKLKFAYKENEKLNKRPIILVGLL